MGFRKTLKIFYHYYHVDRWKILFGLVCLLLVDVLVAVQPRILKWFVDQVTFLVGDHGDKSYTPFIWIGLAYAGAAIAQGVFRYGWRNFIVRSSHRAAERIRAEYFAKLQKLPPSFYDQKPIGDLMALGTNDIEAIRFALGPGLIVFADAIFLFLVLPPAMLMLSPKLTLICLAPLFAIPFIVSRLEKLVHDHFRNVQAQFSKLSAFAQENIEGIRIIKAFVREWNQIDRFSSLGKEFVRLNLKLTKAQSVFDPMFYLAISLGLVSLLIFSGKDVITGVVSIGTFVAFTRYLDQLIWPLMAFGLSATWFQRGKSSLSRVLHILSHEEEEEIQQLTEVAPSIAYLKQSGTPTLEVRDLSFTYPGQTEPSLKKINFKITQGSRTAIVGPVGSGKSTLIKILCGLYPIPEKTVYFCGQDVALLPLKDRRELLAVVPQEIFLFSETLAWNISLGKKEKDSKYNELLARAGLKNEAGVWKLNQRIGEKGLNLSGGQRARVSLSRALYRTQAPLLILDDALSSVDSITESNILAGLKSHLSDNQDQSLLMITHRITRLWDFDQVLVLNEGKLEQHGLARELSDQPGLFKKLLELQRFEDELEL